MLQNIKRGLKTSFFIFTLHFSKLMLLWYIHYRNNFQNFLFINFLNLIFNILLIHKIVVSCVDGKNFVKYIVIGILIIELLLFFLISKFINSKTKYLKIYYLNTLKTTKSNFL